MVQRIIKMRHELYLLAILIVMLLAACKPETNNYETYDWNGGYCDECGGHLIYDRTGSKEHYICEKCGKEFTFDKVMSKKEE